MVIPHVPISDECCNRNDPRKLQTVASAIAVPRRRISHSSQSTFDEPTSVLLETRCRGAHESHKYCDGSLCIAVRKSFRHSAAQGFERRCKVDTRDEVVAYQ